MGGVEEPKTDMRAVDPEPSTVKPDPPEPEPAFEPHLQTEEPDLPTEEPAVESLGGRNARR